MKNGAIEEMAFNELLISCQFDGCDIIYEPSILKPATDPVEAWAAEMAEGAIQSGWTVNESGAVFCKKHSD